MRRCTEKTFSRLSNLAAKLLELAERKLGRSKRDDLQSRRG